MKIFLDTNVILDSMLQRKPWHADSDAVLKAASEGNIVCATTPLSLATVFYVGRRVVGTDQARADIRTYLKAFDILPLDKETLIIADSLPGNDFEDNIQIAATQLASLDAIVTRNVADYSHSSLTVWTPLELVQHLKTDISPTNGGNGHSGDEP